MCEAGVATNADPTVHLVVCFEASRVTLIVRAYYDTIVVEVAKRGVELAFLVAAVDADVILLAEGVAVGLIDPVIGEDGIDVAVIVDAVAECRTGVELSVVANEVLTVGYGIGDVAQAAFCRRFIKCGIGVLMRLRRGLPLCDVGVVKCCIIGFKVLGRIVYRLISF